MKYQKSYNLTETQINKIKMERGIFTSLFKYLEFKGFLYSVPFSATMEQWDEWRADTKKRYPIQHAIREAIESFEYTLWRKWRTLRYKVKTLFRPENAMIRKAVPKGYSDITSLILDVNFATILQFKKEADASSVDWSACEEHAEFKKWLDSACVWINEGRVNLEKEESQAYPDFSIVKHMRPSSMDDYNALYAEVNRLEALIDQTDENILIQMIKYRNYFWT